VERPRWVWWSVRSLGPRWRPPCMRGSCPLVRLPVRLRFVRVRELASVVPPPLLSPPSSLPSVPGAPSLPIAAARRAHRLAMSSGRVLCVRLLPSRSLRLRASAPSSLARCRGPCRRGGCVSAVSPSCVGSHRSLLCGSRVAPGWSLSAARVPSVSELGNCSSSARRCSPVPAAVFRILFARRRWFRSLRHLRYRCQVRFRPRAAPPVVRPRRCCSLARCQLSVRLPLHVLRCFLPRCPPPIARFLLPRLRDRAGCARPRSARVALVCPLPRVRRPSLASSSFRRRRPRVVVSFAQKLRN
jgi:hypothetical protein